MLVAVNALMASIDATQYRRHADNVIVTQALKAKGAGKVIVSEVAERRKEYATEFGADIILDPSKEDVVARVKELTDNVGVAVVYDCAGECFFIVLLRMPTLPLADHILRPELGVQVGLDTGIQCLRVHG